MFAFHSTAPTTSGTLFGGLAPSAGSTLPFGSTTTPTAAAGAFKFGVAPSSTGIQLGGAAASTGLTSTPSGGFAFGSAGVAAPKTTMGTSFAGGALASFGSSAFPAASAGTV